ncbi:MAG: IclR family transcriptional regulator [Chloroflexota bacterium]|nr:IclR family transcriptional regulator [Chloroflexota bacterium]
MATIDNLVALLELFLGEPELGVREMGRRTGISKSTVQRLASSLAQADFLLKDADSGRYSLGLRFLDFAALVQVRNELLKTARPVLRSLAQLSGETAHLGVLHRLEVVYLAHIGSQTDGTVYQGRTRAQAYATSVGKAILAFQEGEQIERIIATGLEAFTSNTITDGEALRKELSRVRQQGYALSVEELVWGARGVGAPIRLPSGAVTSGLSITAPAERMNRGKMAELARPVMAAAEEISRALA